MANFNTKVNFSNQIIQYPNTTGTLSGSVNVEQYTILGVDYSDLPLGLDPSSTGSTYFSIGVFGNFSGDTGSTTFYFSDPNMYLGTPYLSALTPSNSGVTQNIFVIQPISSLTVDGNNFDIYFSGVTYDLISTTFIEYSPGLYSGDLFTNILVYVSGTTYPWWFLKSGSTTWNEIKGRLKTDKITISQSASTGYVLTALDSDGNATWQPSVNNTFTGNTSATCITDLYISNLNSCSPLHIQNVSSGDVLIGENGGVNVGIGTNTPNYKLHVSGKTYIEGDVDILGNVNIIGSATTINTEVVQSKDNKILLNYSGTNSTAIGGGIEILSAKTNGNSVELVTDINGDWNSNTGLNVVGRADNSTSYSLKIQNSGGTNNFVVRGDGNVGIGVNSPTQKLFVSGNTRSENNIDGDVSIVSVNTNNGGILARAALNATVIADTLGRTLGGSFIVGGYNTDTSAFSFGDNGTGYLKNSLSITVTGNPPRGDINIGTRDSSKFLRFFAGSPNFDDTSLRGSLEGVNGYWGFGQNMTGQTAVVHIKGNGNTSATNSLKIDNNSNSPLFYVRDDGNVGIGIENPTEKLQISGNTKISGGLNIGTIGSGSPLINLGLDSNGNIVTGTTGGGSGSFTGGTGSCITDLYVTNIHGCSPINVLDTTIFNYGGTNVIINSGTTVLRTTNNNVIFSESDGTYTRLFNFHNNPGVRDDILLEVVETATTETTQLLVGVGSITNRITNNDNYSVYQFSTNGVDFRDLSQNQFSGMTFNLSYNVYNPSTSNVNLTYTNDVVTPFYIHNRGYDITNDSLYYDISISANSIVFGSTDGLPTAKFDIAYSGGSNNLRIRDGAQNGYVLTSDSNGYATWQASTGGGSGTTIVQFTGNTSGSCITDLYVTNIHGCSPITVHDILSGNSTNNYLDISSINDNLTLYTKYSGLDNFLSIGSTYNGIKLQNGILTYLIMGGGSTTLQGTNQAGLTTNNGGKSVNLTIHGISLLTSDSSGTGGSIFQVKANSSAGLITTGNLTGGTLQSEIVFGKPSSSVQLPIGVMGTGLGTGTNIYGTIGFDYYPVFVSTPRSYAYDNASYSSIKNVLFGGGSDNSVYSGVTNSSLIGGSGNTINRNVKNSVILGGKNITATTSNTVYVPDLVIKKSASVPTTSGDTVGEVGSVTWDDNYFYIKTNLGWGRIGLDYTF